MLFNHYDLNDLVRDNHELRTIDKIVSFAEIAKGFIELERDCGRKGYGVEVGIRCLFAQFYYDLSDRQMENRMRDDMAVRWFCGIDLEQESPDHSYLGRIRETLGTRRIGKAFKRILRAAEDVGILRRVFTFVDASAIKAKETTWIERDKALKKGEAALNNSNVEKYSADKDARFGCKGKDKFWYGYKRHSSVDMGSGLIRKTAATPANVTDQKGLEKICPKGGMVVGDKSYCLKEAQSVMKANGCHSGAILKNNMKGKNRDKDRWLTKIRAPFENVFSKVMKRTRFRGIEKVQLQCFMEAIVFNVKRLVTLNSSPLFATA